MSNQLESLAPRAGGPGREALDRSRDEDEELSLVVIANAALRYRRRITGIALLMGLVTTAVVALLPSKYTTTVSFVPTTSGSASLLSGLAAQIGVNIGSMSGESSQPPQFYVDLIGSNEFLQRILSDSLTVLTDGKPLRTTIADLYDISEDTPGETMAETIKLMNDKVLDIGSSRETGVVRVQVTTKWSTVSKEIGRRILDQIDAFNLSMRRNQAEAESHFMQARVDSARAEMRLAEDRLQTFLQGNREYKTDPRLLFTHDRLEREVTMRQEVYTTVSQAFEQARIEAVRNTPSISAVEPAREALIADRKHLLLKALLATMLAGAGALIGFVWYDLRTRERLPDERAEWAEFNGLLRDTRADLMRLLFLRRRRRTKAKA